MNIKHGLAGWFWFQGNDLKHKCNKRNIHIIILLFIDFRSAIMLWFLWELRNTMKYEHSTRKLDFLLHFGASSLVWFIYLPVVAIVASQVSPLWRYKLLLGNAFLFLHI